jgi:hypothetical protein
MIVSSKEDWLAEYRKDKSKLWFWIYFNENEFLAFNDYYDWFQLIENRKNIVKIKLQYKSAMVEHTIPDDCEGLYLVRSVLCKLLDDDYIHTTTIGFLKNGIINKIIYINRGLIERYRDSSNIEDCFDQAIYKLKG